MTQLASITNNHIAFMCSCGHSPNVPVVDLITKYGREVTVAEVMRRAKCSSCNLKGRFEFRIIYIGGSGEAMLGATAKPSQPKP